MYAKSFYKAMQKGRQLLRPARRTDFRLDAEPDIRRYAFPSVNQFGTRSARDLRGRAPHRFVNHLVTLSGCFGWVAMKRLRHFLDETSKHFTVEDTGVV